MEKNALPRALLTGGDARMIYAARGLRERGFDAVFGVKDEKSARIALAEAGSKGVGTAALFDALSSLSASDALILPLPVTRDGIHVNDALFGEKNTPAQLFSALAPGTRVFCGMATTAVSDAARDARVELTDYYADESFLTANAALTAEGATAELIRLSPRALLGSKAVIFGFGRCGFALALRLVSLGVKVTVVARNAAKRALAGSVGAAAVSPEGAATACESADLAINTVPAPVIGAREAARLGANGVFVLELADRPGVSEEAKGLVQIVRAAGLPGRFSPASAGELIAASVAAAMSP